MVEVSEKVVKDCDDSQVFEFFNGLNINGHTENKEVGGKTYTYLSWPWAWAEVKKRYPDAHYTIWRDENGLPYSMDAATGYMVFTSVTIDGITHEMWLPVMDGANRAMKSVPYDYTVKNPNYKYAKRDQGTGKMLDKYGHEQTEYLEKHCEAASMMDINKAIMRCLVKNLAMFGLGLYIYAGEDLPESEQQDNDNSAEQNAQQPKNQASKQQNTGKTTMTASDKVPPAEPPAPAQPNYDVSTGSGYIANEMIFMAKRLGLDKDQMKARFGVMRKALIDGGTVEDIPSNTISLEKAKALIQAMYDTFMSDMQGRAS